MEREMGNDMRTAFMQRFIRIAMQGPTETEYGFGTYDTIAMSK